MRIAMNRFRYRLSGLSPFMGDSDVDTFANITRADYDFDDEAFEAVTKNAKDFISSLLVHRKEDRLSAKQCLASIWLTQENDDSSSKIRICTDKLKKFIIRRKWQVGIRESTSISAKPTTDPFNQNIIVNARMLNNLNAIRVRLISSTFRSC